MHATVPGVEVVLGSPLLINNVDTLALAAAPIQVLVSTKLVPNEGVGPATIAISKGSGKIKEVFSDVMSALQFPNGTEYRAAIHISSCLALSISHTMPTQQTRLWNPVSTTLKREFL